jgi:hypothetical protein
MKSALQQRQQIVTQQYSTSAKFCAQPFPKSSQRRFFSVHHEGQNIVIFPYYKQSWYLSAQKWHLSEQIPSKYPWVQDNVQKISKKIQKEIYEAETAPPDTWKYKLYHQGNYFHSILTTIGNNLLSKLEDPMELFFRDVSPFSKSASIHFPPSLTETEVASKILKIIRERKSSHKRYAFIWVLLVPITFAMTVLPGPNVFLAFNAYRV